MNKNSTKEIAIWTVIQQPTVNKLVLISFTTGTFVLI
jgi:hypothetical protein